jgi:hypothetical protein
VSFAFLLLDGETRGSSARGGVSRWSPTWIYARGGACPWTRRQGCRWMRGSKVLLLLLYLHTVLQSLKQLFCLHTG